MTGTETLGLPGRLTWAGGPMKKSLFRFALIVLYLGWLAGWFWGFSFAYGPSFFEYHLDTRLHILFLALFAVAIPPLVGYGVDRARDPSGTQRAEGFVFCIFLHPGFRFVSSGVFARCR